MNTPPDRPDLQRSTLRYPVVLFDLDETLFDFASSERLAFADLAAWAAIDEADRDDAFATYRSINSALWKQVEAGTIGPDDVRHRRAEQFNAALNLDLDSRESSEVFIRGLGAHGDLYDGVVDLMTHLHAHATLALVTNGIGIVQRTKIARLQLDRWFPVAAISGDLGMSKPRPAIFDHALGALGVVDRERVLMVGDSLNSDVAGAHAAGIDSCWFNPNDRPADSGSTPTWTIRSLDELPSLIGL